MTGPGIPANPLRVLFADDVTAANAWVSSNSAYAAEVLSHAGYDAVTIDCQHGMFGVGDAVTLLQAVSAGPAVPMARTPSLDAATIGKLLDAGALGIVCPGIDTAEQGRAFVAACRYPPRGRRSFGPARGLLVGGPNYVDTADDLVLAWAMVESATALDNLDEILAVDDLDGVYVGPNDLAMSLGERPGGGEPSGPVLAALTRVVGSAHEAGRLAGAFCAHLPTARALAEMGYNLITPGNDVFLLREAAVRRIAALREGEAGDG